MTRRLVRATASGLARIGVIVAGLACEPHTILELPPDESAEPEPTPSTEPEPGPAPEQPEPEPATDAAPAPRSDTGAETLAALRHRYSFSGSGTLIADSAGGAHGLLLGGASLSGTNGIELDGVDDYVQLPDGLISGLDTVTLMVWATWRGAACWERLFDFGNNLVVGGRVEADTSLFMTPHFCQAEPRPAVRLEFRTTPEDLAEAYLRFTAAGPDVLTAPEPRHYVATLDSEAALMVLYIDGSQVGTSSLVDADGAATGLADLRDTDNWLGRSQYLVDAFFVGELDEFRIYAAALDPEQVQAAFEAGPDAVVELD